MAELHRNLINGEWVEGTAARNINPSNTNDVVGEYAQATAEQANLAIAAAKQAFPRLVALRHPRAPCAAAQDRR